MLKVTKQTLDKMCIAVFNESLHRNSICPGNHDVVHEGDGVFYMDGEAVNRWDLFNAATEKFERGDMVLYSTVWNTYIVAPY